MDSILTTKRLLLREFILADASAMYNLNSDPEVLKYTGDKAFGSVEEARVFLEKYDEYRKHGFGRWAVIRREKNDFIGWCGLKNHNGKFVDIGFRLMRSEWNKGYAFEAAASTLTYGFKTLMLDEIIGRAASSNKASIRILEKLGMDFIRIDSLHGIDNACIYSIKKEQFL